MHRGALGWAVRDSPHTLRNWRLCRLKNGLHAAVLGKRKHTQTDTKACSEGC